MVNLILQVKFFLLLNSDFFEQKSTLILFPTLKSLIFFQSYSKKEIPIKNGKVVAEIIIIWDKES